MKKEAMRLAVAEVLYPNLKPFGYVAGDLYGWSETLGSRILVEAFNLDFMHQAESLIYVENETPAQAQKRVLYEVTLFNLVEHPIRATADQRCEAFLKTFGLWVEEKGDQ